MKNFSRVFSGQALLVVAALWISHAPAQTLPVSVVNMHVTDPYATEAGDTATFAVTRTGPTNYAVNVAQAASLLCRRLPVGRAQFFNLREPLPKPLRSWTPAS